MKKPYVSDVGLIWMILFLVGIVWTRHFVFVIGFVFTFCYDQYSLWYWKRVRQKIGKVKK